MATSDRQNKTAPGAGPGAAAPARAGAPDARRAGVGSPAAGPRRRGGGENGRSQVSPKINLIVADPARVRITRKARVAVERPSQPRQTQSAEDAFVFGTVPTDRLHSSRSHWRAPYDATAIRALAASMRTAGWREPILVRPHPMIAREYEIVVGELPVRAARLAGLPALPVAVCHLSDRRALECLLLEDVQRPDLAPFEVALGYGQLIRNFNYSLAKLAQLVGKSERQVARLLLLLDSPEACRQAPEAEVADLDRSRPTSQALDAAGQVATLPADGTGAAASALLRAEIAALERYLSSLLGLNVEMTTHGRSGALTLSFEDFGELEKVARHISSFALGPGAGRGCPGLAA